MTDRLKSYSGAIRGMRREGEPWRTLAGVEAIAMLAKGPVPAVPGNDMPAQRIFVHQIFGLAA